MNFNFPTTPREAGKGTLISFLPLKIGSGASTLACMSSLIMSRHTNTSIIDFSFESKVRSYLGFQDLEVSNVSILNINGATTPEGVFAASEEHPTGLKVFPGVSSRVLDSAQIDTSLSLKAVTYIKQVSPLNFAVLGPLHMSSWITAMLSDCICLVVKPDRANQDAFRETIDFLNRLGCSDRLKIILNQVGYPGCVEEKGISNFFSPDIIIKYDKKIPAMCNRRNITPNRQLRDILFRLVKGVESHA